MLEIELAFLICPTFINILSKKIVISDNRIKSENLKNFQTILDKTFEKNTFSNSLPFPQFNVAPRNENLQG